MLLIVICVAAVFILSSQKRQKNNIREETTQTETDTKDLGTEEDVLKNALNLFIKEKESGRDFTNGPCLGEVSPGWVLDIAHNPRLPADDKKENQCEKYLSGEAKHFIELDPEGNLIGSR